MSNPFKFLSAATDSGFGQSGQQASAAQDFLSKQMAKNKFLDTAQPIENVGKNLTTDPYAYGEGTVPGGEGYKDQQTVLNQKEIDAWHAANPDGGKGGGVKIQRTQASGEKFNSLDVDDLRAKFGLTYDESVEKQGFKSGSEGEETNNDNQVWYKDGSGEMKLLGIKQGGLDSLLNNKELQNVRASDRDRFSEENEFNSASDVAGTLRYLLKESEGETEGPPKPKMGIKPIEHSQEIKQAKERVKTFEQDMESGKMSKENFGNSNLLDKYSADYSKGADGIGANAASSGQESANSATQSFLDNKMTQVKKTLSPA